MKVGIKIVGAAELEKALGELSVRVSRKVAREALEFGGEPMRSEASNLAPRKSPAPDLADNVVIAPAKAIEGEMAAVAIGPRKGFAYGLPQEIGTSRHPAQPFMRPAFDSKREETLARIGQELWRALAERGISRSVSDPTSVDDSAFEAGGIGRGKAQHGRGKPLIGAGRGGVF